MTEKKKMTINEAMLGFHGEMTAVTRDGKNPHFNSKYATIDNILISARSLLHKHDLFITQTFQIIENQLILQTAIKHISGEEIFSNLPITRLDNDQKFGSRLTYYRRYTLAAILGIATEEDDDANSTSLPKNQTIEQLRNYIIKAGKNKGMKLGDYSEGQLLSFTSWVLTIDNPARTLKEDFEHAEALLNKIIEEREKNK
jgi:hypothetical protein